MSQRRSHHAAKLPVYKRIESDIRAKIHSGQWPAGSALPSRQALTKLYDVGLPTLEHAIEQLLADGTLRAVHGKGTFVADREVGAMQDAQEASHSRDMAKEVLHLLPVQKHFAPRLGIAVAGMPSLPPSDTNWTAYVVRAMERAFSLAGGTIVYAASYFPAGEVPSLQEMITTLLANDISAIVVANLNNERETMHTLRDLLDRRQVPVVLISWQNLKGPFCHVLYDHFSAGYDAAEHLLQVGYYPLVYLDVADIWWSHERLEGAREAVAQAGLPDEACLAFSCESPVNCLLVGRDRFQAIVDHTAAALFGPGSLVEQALQTAARPLGIIAPTDAEAERVLHVARQFNKQAGKDFGLVGFDDAAGSAVLGLTSLAPPLEEIGEEATHQLFRMLQGHRATFQVRLRSRLIRRASTQHP